MIPSAVLLFVAIACASVSSASNERRDVFSDDDRQIFERSPEGKSIIQRYEPFYYVSYDLYENTCTSERCSDVAHLFLSNVRKSTKACDDFYKHACGRKPSPKESLMKEIKDILEQQSIEKEQVKSLTLEKKFYRSCMAQRENDYKTKNEFSKIMELSNGAGLFRRAHRFGTTDWQSIDSFYAFFGFEHAFFNVHVTRDPQLPNVNLIALMPPSPLYFYSVHGLLKNKNVTNIISNLLGYYDQASPYVVDYDDVIEFNDALHEILPPLGMFEENMTTLINNKMTVDEWQNIYNLTLRNQESLNYSENNINWLKMLNKYLKSANLRINKFEKITLKKIEYFIQLSNLLKKTSPITIEKYIHFKFIMQIGKYLDPNLARVFENIPDRSTFCIKQFDNQLIGVTYEYIKRHVPREQKIYAEKVMDNVRNALMHLLSDANWMDNKTKSLAITKLEKLNMMIGYPDWQINRTFVHHYYGNLRLNTNFFENVIRHKRRTLIHELHGLKYPSLYDPLTMSKRHVPLINYFEVNSYTDRIFFPAEYLNEKKYKLFSSKLPSAINYGSFGSMLGSILYDYVSLTDNLKYNEFYTRTNDGLSKDTIEAYKVKEKCLTHQLTNYKKFASNFEEPLASVIDLDTIQVDKTYEKITGLRAAFEAYKKHRRSNEEFLPGFEHMHRDQLFFLSYAQRICEIGDIYDQYDAYETSLKVNGVVSNLQDFSDVFQCPRGSEMNREVKCELFS